MPRHATPVHAPVSRRPRERAQPLTWKLTGAKARFNEVVRRARTEGPQCVTVRGKDAVAVIAVETLEKLLPPAKPRQNLVTFLQDLGIGDLDLTREHNVGHAVIW
jgi:prevent-host-death family protein